MTDATGRRTCGPCAACCTVFHIEELPRASPRWVPCYNLTEGGGCGIYADRPQECRRFRCAWLDGLGEEEDRPDLLGLVLEQLPARPRIDVVAKIHATEARLDAAKSERGRAVLRALRADQPVVLVPFHARGEANWGEELPADF